jgi:hypothetical protein
MPVKAKFWQGHWRIKEAADTPLRSLHLAAWNTNDTGAVSLLQFALIRIQLFSPRLRAKDLPTHPDYIGSNWGPFGLDDTDAFKVGTFDNRTYHAVSLFQIQASLVSDGRAGMHTLHRLDGILVAIDKFPPIGPPAP